MSQPLLFETDANAGAYGHRRDDGPTLPHNGKATSKAAAVAAEPKAETWRGKVLAFIREQGQHGATRDEAIEALGMNPSTLRPRWVELEAAGLIVNSGRTRINAGGNKVEVYVAVEAMRDVD